MVGNFCWVSFAITIHHQRFYYGTALLATNQSLNCFPSIFHVISILQKFIFIISFFSTFFHFFLNFTYVLFLILEDFNKPLVIQGCLRLSLPFNLSIRGKLLLYNSVNVLINSSYAAIAFPLVIANRAESQFSLFKAAVKWPNDLSLTILKVSPKSCFISGTAFPNQTRIGKWSEKSLTITEGLIIS